MTPTPIKMLLVAVSALALAACEQSTKDAQADAIRDASDASGAAIDERADAVVDAADNATDDIEEQAEDSAEAMRERADAVRERGESQADAVDDGTIGATTRTGGITTTTTADPK